MTQLVPSDKIEENVGALRHPIDHYGRAVADEEIFYILHSEECRANVPDPPCTWVAEDLCSTCGDQA